MLESLNHLQEAWKDLLHIGLAYVLTAVIGWDREKEAHSAGLRTFPIVGMASCGYLMVLGNQPDVAAQSRVLQGLITGIGFVGGGAILKEGATVKGTATAASIWNAGVIGASVAVTMELFLQAELLPVRATIRRFPASLFGPPAIASISSS